MIDKNKTDFLRKKIQEIKKEGSKEESKEKSKEKSKEQLQNLLTFFLRYLVFHGAQSYVLSRTEYPPFSAWESLVILLALSNFLSVVKKDSK